MSAGGEALVLFAHGSRDPQWAEPFRAIAQTVRAKRPGVRVELAFLEFMKPTLPELAATLAGEGYRRLRIAPLFMAQGAHLKNDLRELLDSLHEREPDLEVSVLRALGESPEVLEAASTWIAHHV